MSDPIDPLTMARSGSAELQRAAPLKLPDKDAYMTAGLNAMSAWSLLSIAESLSSIAGSLMSLVEDGVETYQTHDGSLRER